MLKAASPIVYSEKHMRHIDSFNWCSKQCGETYGRARHEEQVCMEHFEKWLDPVNLFTCI